jgi:hypothetical protein
MKYVVRLADPNDKTYSEYVQSFESRKNAEDYADTLNEQGDGYYYVELED